MPARYETIAKWVNGLGWRRGAELGVYDGRTHFHLLDHCRDLHLVGVDVWNLPSFREGPTKSGERCFCPYCAETRASRRAASVEQMRDRVMREALAEPYRGRSNILFMTTADASRHVDDGSLDFVFIDADHSTEGVRADINAWRPKIRAGGVLFGHDYNMKSVRDAVQSVYKGWQISLGDDHLWRVNC